MGIFDSFKSKASELMNKAGDVAGDLTDKAKDGEGDLTEKARNQMGDRGSQAGDMADDATGGRFGDQIDQGVDIARQRMGDADEAMRADVDQQS
jgi:antitoxin protein of toxin-antitoxin system